MTSIENGIPMPESARKRVNKDFAQVVARMENTQSILYPYPSEPLTADELKKFKTRVQAVIAQAKKFAPGKVYVSRKLEHEDGIRIWRVA